MPRTTIMTTCLRNVLFIDLIIAFRKGESIDPLPVLAVIDRCIGENGQIWLATDEGRAILHLLIRLAHGEGYRIDSDQGRERLEGLYRDFDLTHSFHSTDGGAAG